MIRTIPIRTHSHTARAIRDYIAEEERRESENPQLRTVARTSMHLWLSILADSIEQEFAQSNVVQFPRDGAA